MSMSEFWGQVADGRLAACLVFLVAMVVLTVVVEELGRLVCRRMGNPR